MNTHLLNIFKHIQTTFYTWPKATVYIAKPNFQCHWIFGVICQMILWYHMRWSVVMESRVETSIIFDRKSLQRSSQPSYPPSLRCHPYHRSVHQIENDVSLMLFTMFTVIPRIANCVLLLHFANKYHVRSEYRYTQVLHKIFILYIYILILYVKTLRLRSSFLQKSAQGQGPVGHDPDTPSAARSKARWSSHPQQSKALYWNLVYIHQATSAAEV